MQSYPINMIAGAATSIQASARRFVYESGINQANGGDPRIVVKPGNGNEILLRAGQSFALPEGQHVEQWNIKPYDPTATVTGVVIIGSGEFDDNSFKIDANSGNVPVSVIGDLTDMYGASWQYGAAMTPGQVVEIVPAAANVRGIRVHQVMFTLNDPAGGNRQALIANPNGTPPNNGAATDSGPGVEVLAEAYATGVLQLYERTLKVIVPPGRALYWLAVGTAVGNNRQVKYTVL